MLIKKISIQSVLTNAAVETLSAQPLHPIEIQEKLEEIKTLKEQITETQEQLTEREAGIKKTIKELEGLSSHLKKKQNEVDEKESLLINKEQELKDEFEEERLSLEEEFSLCLSTINKFKEELLTKNKDILIDLTVELTQKLLQTQIETDPNTLKSLINNAIQDIKIPPDKNLLTLSVHPDDYQASCEYASQLTEHAQGKYTIQVQELDSIHPGSCQLSSKYGTLDLNFNSQLQLFKKKMLGGN